MKFSTMTNSSLAISTLMIVPGNCAQSDPSSWKFLDGFFFQTEPCEIEYLEEDRVTENRTFRKGEPYLSQKACALKRNVLNSSNGVEQYEYTIQFWKARHYVNSHADVNIESYLVQCDNSPYDNEYFETNQLWPKSANEIDEQWPSGTYCMDMVKKYLQSCADCFYYRKEVTQLWSCDRFHPRGRWPELAEGKEQRDLKFWAQADIKPCREEEHELLRANEEYKLSQIDDPNGADSGDASSLFDSAPSKPCDIVTKCDIPEQDREMRNTIRSQSQEDLEHDRTRNDASADSGDCSDGDLFLEPASDKTSQPGARPKIKNSLGLYWINL